MLKPLQAFFYTAFVILLAGSSAISAQTPEVPIYGIGKKIILHSSSKLLGQQRSNYRQWRGKGGYFGAFAVHSDNVHTFWTLNMHSLQTARQVAVWGCEEQVERVGVKSGSCSLYASVIPKSMDPHKSVASGLSERALKAFNGKYKNSQRKGRWGAFAISGLADFGFSFEYLNKSEAIGAALSYCEASASSKLPARSNKFREYIKSNRLHDCKVVHITGP